MEFRQLSTFVSIVKLGGFTKAAQQLGYAQSTITGHIQLLEQELGAVLFERIGKVTKLTKEGERFFAYAEQLLKISAEAKELIGSSKSPQGQLTIGVPESLCMYRLSGILQMFRTQFPKVEIQFKFGSYDCFRSHLRQNSIDVAFFLERPCSEQDFITQVLFEEPMAVISSPDHALASREGVAPMDLNDQRLVLTENGCSYRRLFESILVQTGVKAASVMAISSNEVIKKFVGDGWGIGFLPRIVVQDELNKGSLALLNWTGPPFAVQAQLVYHRDKWLSPSLQAFLNLVFTVYPPQKKSPAV